MCAGIISPGHDPSPGQISWEKVAEPVDFVARGPCLLPVSVKAMDGDDARRKRAR